MPVISPFWLCTNSFPVDDPFEAMDLAAELGFRLIELPSIDGMCEQIVPEKITDSYITEIRRGLSARGLVCYAVSAHSTLTDDRSYFRFMKKLRFACEIGAQRLNTRCGPKKDLDIFLRRVPEILEVAGHYGLKINFESYGDIINDAESSEQIFRMLEHPLIGYNYDPGNLYRFTRGKIDFRRDIKFSFPQLDGLHMKDSILRDGYLTQTAVGSGDIDYAGIFQEIGRRRERIGGGIEVPCSFRVRMSDLAIEPVSSDIESAKERIRRSVDFLQTYLPGGSMR